MKINWTERHNIYTACLPDIGEKLIVIHRKNSYMVSVFSDVQDETFFDLDVAKQFAVDIASLKLKVALASLGEEA